MRYIQWMLKTRSSVVCRGNNFGKVHWSFRLLREIIGLQWAAGWTFWYKTKNRKNPDPLLLLCFSQDWPYIGKGLFLHLPSGCRLLCDKTWKEVAPEIFLSLQIQSSRHFMVITADELLQKPRPGNKRKINISSITFKGIWEWPQNDINQLSLHSWICMSSLVPDPDTPFLRLKLPGCSLPPGLSILKAGLARHNWGEEGILSFSISFVIRSPAPFSSPTFSLPFLLLSMYL